MTQGLQRKELIVLAARTSMGKSAFAIQLDVNANRAGYKTAIFSLEMGKQQVYDRACAAVARIEYGKFRSGNLSDEDWNWISLTTTELSTITVVDQRGMTAEQIADDMRRMKHAEGLDLVVIDYVNLIHEMPLPGDVAGAALKRITQTLRQAADRNDCAMVLVAQINRAVEQRQNKRPMLSDLSESKAIEDAADVVMFLFREDYYDPATEKKNLIEVNIAKQRNGPTGMVELVYLKNYQSIVSMEKGRA